MTGSDATMIFRGKRFRALRFILTLALGILCFAKGDGSAQTVSPVMVATMPYPEEISLALQDRGHEGYEIEGSFIVQADEKLAWAVISDYDHLSRFVSSMNLSNIEKRNADSLLVRQKFSVKVLGFRRYAEVLLNVREGPYKQIQFEDVEKKSFSAYEGSWNIQELDSKVRVVYRLRMEGGMSGLRFFVKRTSKKTAAALLAQVREEIERRAAASSASGGQSR